MYCVDPGTEKEHPDRYPGGKHVVIVGPDTRVCFPFVNSCLALVFPLSDGRLVCGHVAMQAVQHDAPLDPYGCLKRVVGEMLFFSGSPMSGVARLIAVGGYPWDDFYGSNLTPWPTWVSQANIRGSVHRIIVNRWDAFNVYCSRARDGDGYLAVVEYQQGPSGLASDGAGREEYRFSTLASKTVIN